VSVEHTLAARFESVNERADRFMLGLIRHAHIRIARSRMNCKTRRLLSVFAILLRCERRKIGSARYDFEAYSLFFQTKRLQFSLTPRCHGDVKPCDIAC
jgi:hypothetical protein